MNHQTQVDVTTFQDATCPAELGARGEGPPALAGAAAGCPTRAGFALLPGDNADTQWITANENAQPEVHRPIWELVNADPEERGRLVSIIGPPRTGKSTMLNALGRKINAPGGVGPNDSRKWFGESDGVSSFTKGIHVATWCDRGTDQDDAVPLVWLDCEGKGDAGAEFDTSLLLPLYMLSRVVVWNVRTVARDDVLRAADDILVAAERLMGSLEAEEELARRRREEREGPLGQEEQDDQEDAAADRMVANTHHMFGHLIIVLRDCDLEGDPTQLLLADEQVEFRTRRGVCQPRTRLDRHRLERNQRRFALRHCFESVTVVKLPSPNEAKAPMADPAFATSMDSFLTQVQHLARQPFHPGSQSLQCPPPGAGTTDDSTVASGGGTFRWLQTAAVKVADVLRNHGVPHPSGLRAELQEQEEARQREARLEEECDQVKAEAERKQVEFQAHAAEMQQQAEAMEAEMAELAQQQAAEVARLEAEGKTTSEALERMREEMAARGKEAAERQAAAEAARKQHEEEVAHLHTRLKRSADAIERAREDMRKQEEASVQRSRELQEEVRRARAEAEEQAERLRKQQRKQPGIGTKIAEALIHVGGQWLLSRAAGGGGAAGGPVPQQPTTGRTTLMGGYDGGSYFA